LSEAKEEETCKGISMGLKMWRDLGMSVSPKLLVLEDHLLFQLSLFKGLGDYSEDFVEQVHQVGIREEARTFTIKDRKRVAKIHCHNEPKRILSAIKNIQAAVAEKIFQETKTTTTIDIKK
jgi:hypothetical protein